jgi:propanol-preferring alcohol dehydrogenase
MRALVLQAPAAVAEGPLELVDVPARVARSGELLMRVRACAVCRTDLQLCEGDLAPRRLPVVPGHQAVGRVEAIGAGVDGWAVGDRVATMWLASACGSCKACRGGRENLCRAARFTGWDVDGGFAEQTAVRADFALRPPGSFGDAAAAPLLCGGIIGYRSLCVAEVEPGQNLALYGFGASARLALQVARHWGCEEFVCTRSAAEQRVARELGAVWAGGYDEPPPVPLDAAITFAPSATSSSRRFWLSIAAAPGPSTPSTWIGYRNWRTSTCGGSAASAASPT